MRGLFSRAILTWLCQFLSVAVVSADSDESDAVAPPNSTPAEFAAMQGTYFVKFFSPYCGHCKASAPKWDAAYRAVGGPDTTGFQWANVDCVQFSDFCQAQSISGYPTSRVYRDAARVHDFGSSGPSEADLVAFAQKYAEIGDEASNAKYETADEASAKATRETPAANTNDAEDAAKTPAATVTVPSASSLSSADTTKTSKVSSDRVTVWHADASATGQSVGRWIVSFVAVVCESCPSISSKWENHGNFARDYQDINWAVVDCDVDSAFCFSEEVESSPTVRIYEDGQNVYTYDGPTSSASSRSLAKHASHVKNFDQFDIEDLENTASADNANLDGHSELAGPTDDPQYMSGPVVPKPEYKKPKPDIADVVKYTIETLGQPIDADPGKLIFGDSPEAHHNFRTWSAPNAPPPPPVKPGSGSTHADGIVWELVGRDFDEIVKQNSQPWLIKFYSPKCPHCRDMAKVYNQVAEQSKGQVNVGAVNCDVDPKVCRQEKVSAWPTMRMYRGSVASEEFTGSRSVKNIKKYAMQVFEAQIFPIANEQELVTEIIHNMDKNSTTYVYSYDQSVMAEDWESSEVVAANVAVWGGKIYRTDDAQLRELAGINHRGTAFVNVDLSGDRDTGKSKWYDYPYSNIPKKIRDSTEVSKWAYRAKWSSSQYSNPQGSNAFSPYTAVLLTEGKVAPSEDASLSEHKVLSLEFRDFYRERQIKDQDKMRIDRSKQHDAALVESNFKLARYIMSQPLDNQVRVDLAFAYMPSTEWKARYGKFLDVSDHNAGDVIVVDFYNGVYLNEFNLVPIKDDKAVLMDSVESSRRFEVNHPKTSFRFIRKFKKTCRGIPKPEYRSTHFHSKPYPQDHSAVARAFQVLAVLGSSYLVYRRFSRARSRSFASQRRSSYDDEWQDANNNKHD